MQTSYSYHTAVRDGPGGLTSYAYNFRDWLTDIKQSGTGLTRFTDLAGSATVLVTASTYDDADRLTNLTHKTAGGTTRASYGYTLDAASRLTSEARTWTTASGTASDTLGYTYTNDSQLTGVSHSNGSFAAESFGYDANGNRNTTGYGTGTGNRLSADGTHTYQYDAEGNMSRRTVVATGAYRVFAYDHRNRLTSVTDKTAGGTVTGQVSYTYDALDRRIKVAAGANVLKVVYDGPAVILDFDGGNAEVARYLQGPAIDEVLARETGSSNTVAWYLQDRLGTVRDIADNAGAIVDHLGYDAFGTVTIETDPSYGDRFKFTGREYDAATGLYYYRARWYDAAAGQFLAEDPIGFGGGDANLSRYVGNAPSLWMDPNGLASTGGLGGLDGPGGPLGGPVTGYWSHFWDDYWHYLYNPEDQDRDIQVAQQGALAVSAACSVVAGGLGIGAGIGMLGTGGAIGGGGGSGLALVGGGIYGGVGGLTTGTVIGGAWIGSGGVAVGLGTTYFCSTGGSGSENPISKSNSPIWQRLKGFRRGTKSNGKTGKDREYYEWDHTHNDIEVYNHKGRHSGSMDPTTGEIIKPAVPGRGIKL